MITESGWEIKVPLCSECQEPLIVYDDEIWKFYTCPKCGAKFPMPKPIPGAKEWLRNYLKNRDSSQ